MSRSWTQFATEFGLTASVRVISYHRGTGESVTVDVPFPHLILGRYTNCPVPLADSSVSNRHAYIQVLAGHVFVLDLHSRRGLQVNDRFVSQGWLPSGKTLQMGEFDLRFFPNPLPTSPNTPDHGVGLPLALTRPSGMPPLSPLRGPITLIGRDPSAHYRLDDDRLSPYHAAIVQTKAIAWVVSLHSVGGVKLNGRQVRTGQLKPGSTLDLNGVELWVQESEADISVGPLVLAETVGESKGEMRDLAILMGKMLAAFQQEQTALLKRQNELLEVIADACRSGITQLPNIVAPLPPSSNVPIPQPLLPREAETLADAHGWLMDRISAIKPKPS